MCVHVTNMQDATRRSAIDTHPPFEQLYITARSRICIYASRIISQLSITSSRLFAGNNGSLLARCSLMSLFLLLPLLVSPTSSTCSALVLTSPNWLADRDAICVSHETSHIDKSIYADAAYVHRTDIHVYISREKNPMSKKKSRVSSLNSACITR